LNSGVNERRRRGFFPMLSMIGHPSGGEPLMMDVRQSGSSPPQLGQGGLNVVTHEVELVMACTVSWMNGKLGRG
jgi:hypothetical protein